jgi:two-component system, cell cycle sensor histidine kinase and response regulator CckA
MNTININTLFRTMEELRCPSIPDCQKIELQLDPELPPIEAEEQHIRCLILSLISYTTRLWANKQLLLTTQSISLSNHELRVCTINNTLSQGSYVEIGVFSTYPLREIRQQADEPGASADEDLAAAKAIIRRYHGALNSSTVPPQGIKAYLPTTALQRAQRKQEPPTARLGTILVVDDENDVRSVVTKMIERIGFQVEAAANGAQAITSIKAGINNLQAVLLDVSMTDMNGLEVAASIHTILPSVPIILMSGYSAEDINHSNNQIAIHSFVQKPFSYKTLESILDTIQRTDTTIPIKH